MSNNIQDIITEEYQNFKKRIAQLIPKVDEDLILQVLKFQTMKEEWPGSVTLKIKYQNDLDTDFGTKKERLYEKYKMLPSEMDERTLQFKALGLYLEDISALSQDPEVEYISGSAEPSHYTRLKLLSPLSDTFLYTSWQPLQGSNLRRNFKVVGDPLKVSIVTSVVATCVDSQ